MKQDELEQRVFELSRQHGMASVMLRNAVSRKLQLNITDMECLSLLTVKGISSPKELASYTGMTSGAATSMLDRLERANFITREANPKDRRGVIIRINQAAMKKVGQSFAGAQTAQLAVINNYSVKELKVIADFLERISNSIIEQVNVLTVSK